MRFVVAREVMASLIAVLDLLMTSQLKTLRLCHLPFPWSGLSGPWESVRQGVLIGTADGTVQRGTCVLAASAGPQPAAMPEQFTFDWREN